MPAVRTVGGGFVSKLLGRLGWHGQCACCNGPRDKRQIKRDEDRQWRREADERCSRHQVWDMAAWRWVPADDCGCVR